MELFLLEHKKLWRKRSTKISVMLCFIYIVVFGSILSYQWFTFGSSDNHTSAFGNHFDGYSMIRNRQAYSRSFGGELTDETLQEIINDYQKIEAADIELASDITDWQTIDNYLSLLWPELKDTDIYKIIISYVDSEKVTGLYERRQQAIESFLENNGQTGQEKDYLLRINESVKTPFHYEWSQGWATLLGDVIPDLGSVLALFLSIVLSSLFAGEWRNNTSALVLTTRHGWKTVACAKILTGFAFALELYLLLSAGNIVSQLLFLGVTGWDMPIQIVKLTAIAPMNMLQAEIYEYVFLLLGIIGFTGIVMLISAAVKNNVSALLLSLAVIYTPLIITKYLPYEIQKMLDLIPLVGSSADIFRTNTFHIFGAYIWSPYLLITVPVLIGLICLPFTVSCWAKRQKA